MSLENQIAELTKAVQELTKAISAEKPMLDFDKLKKSVEVVTEQASEEASVSHDDLKAVCLKVARTGKKDEVKGVLAVYDAVKAVDVAADKITEVIEKLEAL